MESATEPGTIHVVTGTVSSPSSPAVAGLDIRLVDKNVGGDVGLVAGHTVIDGTFTLSAHVADRYLTEKHKT
jgi:hypothetical protein